MPAKLYRSRENRMLAGFCGGLSDYFQIDATLIRLLMVLVVLATGLLPGLVFYGVAVAVVPLEPGARLD